MKNKTRNENFSTIGGRTVNEIRDWVLYETQNNKIRYNELVNDFRDYINDRIGIGLDISTETITQEFQPLEPGAIWYYKEFGWMDRNLVFDFITIEPNNSVKLSRLKVSCFWDKKYVLRRDYEKEVERVNNYVYLAIMFRGGCELAIAELFEPQQANEPTTAKNKAKYGFTITLRHIALKAHYEGKNITESDASEFLKGTGLKAGKKLSQFYSFYNNSADRRADPGSKTTLKNKIKLFEEVTSLLPENMRGKVIDETKHLDNFMHTYK